MSADVSPALPPGGAAAGGLSTLRVHAVFHDVDAGHADTIAAEMVARAHELANLPGSECDVDVSIETAEPDQPGAAGSAAR